MGGKVGLEKQQISNVLFMARKAVFRSYISLYIDVIFFLNFDQCTLGWLPSVAGGIKQFFSLFELMCREKNLNSAPSPRQP